MSHFHRFDCSRRTFLASCVVASAAPLAARLLGAQPNEEHVSWLDEIQRPPEKVPPNAPTLPPLLIDADGREITTLKAWEKRREELRKLWTDFLHPLDVPRNKPALKVLQEDKPAGCARQLVEFEGEPGVAVQGYLIRPAEKSSQPRPGVVVLHSTVDYTIRQPAGLEGPQEKWFGLKLAKRGMVTFSPRCFLWEGEGPYQKRVEEFQRRHKKSLGMAKMLFDAMRGLDVLEAQPDVDPKRLGAAGHSLGAKEALYLAAFDERVKAAVASEGGIGTKFSNWDASWYLGEAIKTGAFSREHHELLGMIAPRPYLLVGGDSADGDRGWPFIEAALPVYRLYGEPCPFGQFNHKKGHAVPPEAEARIYEWAETYL
jgi:hypothetical protein